MKSAITFLSHPIKMLKYEPNFSPQLTSITLGEEQSRIKSEIDPQGINWETIPSMVQPQNSLIYPNRGTAE